MICQHMMDIMHLGMRTVVLSCYRAGRGHSLYARTFIPVAQLESSRGLLDVAAVATLATQACAGSLITTDRMSQCGWLRQTFSHVHSMEMYKSRGHLLSTHQEKGGTSCAPSAAHKHKKQLRDLSKRERPHSCRCGATRRNSQQSINEIAGTCMHSGSRGTYAEHRV